VTPLSDHEVLAAGGLVWRQGAHNAHEVVVVHRPRYDDWTLPKGKLDPGETLEECALREVAEETGLRCRLGALVGDVTYVDHKDRTKLVRYWEMTVESGAPTPNDEADEVRWLSLDEVSAILSYPHDLPMVEALRRRLTGL